MNRRDFISSMLATSLAPAVSVHAAHATEPTMSKAASNWKPSKAVELVVHSAQGAGNDMLAREIIAIIKNNGLSDVRFQVSNKPGGGSTAAINYLVSKKGDAHTIALTSNTWITDHMTQEEAKFSALDLTLIAVLAEDPFVVVVRSDSPYATLEDFVGGAKAKPGILNQAGGSPISRDNVVRLSVMTATGASWNYIPFPSGGERIASLLGGHTDIYMTDPVEATEHIRSGRLRAVAQIAPSRVSIFPEVRTIQEIYKVPHLASIRGVAGVPEMPKEAASYYENLFRQVVETAQWKEYSNKNQLVGSFVGSEQAKAVLQMHRNNIRDIATGAGIKVVR